MLCLVESQGFPQTWAFIFPAGAAPGVGPGDIIEHKGRGADGGSTNRWMGVFISRTGIAWRRSQSRSRLLCGPLDMADTMAPSSSEEAYAGQPARSRESNGRNHACKANKWGEIRGGIATMANARGQLWDNYGTTMGQLWDNYGTTYGTTHFLQVFVHFAIFERKIKVFFFGDPKCARPTKIQGFKVVP